MKSPVALLGTILLAPFVFAQTAPNVIPGVGRVEKTYTSYDPDWEQTIVGAVYTTIGGLEVLTTTIATITSTSTTPTRTRTTAVVAATTATTPGNRVQGTQGQEQATYQFTTTYSINGGPAQVWTASVTAAASVATAVVPEGTMVNYQSYQSAQNSVAFSSAAASGGVAAVGVANSASRAAGAIAGWTAVALGGVGAFVVTML